MDDGEGFADWPPERVRAAVATIKGSGPPRLKFHPVKEGSSCCRPVSNHNEPEMV